MNSDRKSQLTPYLTFDRDQWSELRNNVPLTLTEQDLQPLLGINEDLSLDEVSTIFLPLVRLLNYYIDENIHRQTVMHHFLGIGHKKMPYVIGIAGSVASGKSTTSRILQALLSKWPTPRKVDLITTDGFLYNLKTLIDNNLMLRKGFPESYNINSLIKFIYDVKSGKRRVKSPIYSQSTYDILADQFDIVDQPDILIIEGLNVLQDNKLRNNPKHLVFVSDFVDFSIYVDAEEKYLKQWFLERFLKLREGAFKDPKSYFHSYTQISYDAAITFANEVWENINGLNLKKNILPTRERADLILTKGENHTIHTVKLRK